MRKQLDRVIEIFFCSMAQPRATPARMRIICAINSSVQRKRGFPAARWR